MFHRGSKSISLRKVAELFLSQACKGPSTSKAAQNFVSSNQSQTNFRSFGSAASFISSNFQGTFGQYAGRQLSWAQQIRCMGTATRQGTNRTAVPSQRQRSQGSPQQQGMYLIALVVGMVGLTYASVPLYRMFCQATGYGGTVQQGNTVEEKLQKRLQENDTSLEAAAAARKLTVSFNADVSDSMNWKFMPTQRSVKISPGESTLAFYTAHNLSDKAITGVSTYNVSPQQAGAYFNKIQCFCFEEQKLRPGEKIDMPVFFYIDPEFATDPRMRGIDTLTLSYTFFKVDEEDAEAEEDSEPQQSTAIQAAQ